MRSIELNSVAVMDRDVLVALLTSKDSRTETPSSQEVDARVYSCVKPRNQTMSRSIAPV